MAEKTLTIAMRLDGNQQVVKGIQTTEQRLHALAKGVKVVGVAQQKASKQRIDFRQMAAGSTNARMGMMNLQYTLRDAPYLFQNLQMGITAVGENLLMTVTNMQQMKREAGGMRNFMGMLTASLTGPAGFAVALSAVLFVVQSASMILGKMKRNAKETGEVVEAAAWNFDALTASVEDTKAVLDQLKFDQVVAGIAAINSEYEKLKETGLDVAEDVFDDTYSTVDTAALKELKETLAEQEELQKKRALIREKLIADAAQGKLSADRIDEVLTEFEREKNERIKKLVSAPDTVRQSVMDDLIANVDAINEQIEQLRTARENLGDLQSVQLELEEKRYALTRAQGDEARKAIVQEIAALEELQKKLRFETEEETETPAGKSAAGREAEFAAKKLALEEQLAVLKGERTELDVLAAREQRLQTELGTADKERQREIELELLELAMERERIAQRTAEEREKAAERHAEALDKLAEQERENAQKQQELEMMREAGDTTGAIQSRYEMQQALLNQRKQAIQEQLNALQRSLQDGTSMTQSEYDRRLLLAEELKGRLIGIEEQILKAKLNAEQQATQETQRAAQQRMQLLQNQIGQTMGMFMQVYQMTSWNSSASRNWPRR